MKRLSGINATVKCFPASKDTDTLVEIRNAGPNSAPPRHFMTAIGAKANISLGAVSDSDSGGVGSDRIGGVVAVAYQLLHKHMAGVKGVAATDQQVQLITLSVWLGFPHF